jgi:tetratricopeptide (TPR) repeat protein
MNKTLAVILASSCLLTSSLVFSASVEKAQMLSEYGLKAEAKKELVDVIFSKSNENNKSQAYYTLGSIAFDENKISVALDSWKTLVKQYPDSEKAKLVKDRIQELAEIVGESTKESIDNAIALSYLRHGDFWSSDKDSRFTIDSSWIPNVETAIKWYDKVIAEFPKTAASRVAYQDKIRTLLGWKERGQYGSSHGIQESFAKYMPQLLSTFEAFQKEHPKALTLQAFRYQIAQAYWKNKDWNKTKEWLNIVIEKSGSGDSFYKDTAQRRLKKIEY